MSESLSAGGGSSETGEERTLTSRNTHRKRTVTSYASLFPKVTHYGSFLFFLSYSISCYKQENFILVIVLLYLMLLMINLIKIL